MRAASSLAQDNPALTGQICAHTSISASFRASGKIAQRLAKVGDSVRKGQPLAVLDDTILKNTLKSAEADEAAAAAALRQAEQHNARVQGLLAQRAVSKENAESSVRQLKSARAQLEAASARTASAKEQLGYAVLYAEEDGVVTDRLAEAGEVVSQGQPVFKLAVNDGRDAVLDIPAVLLASFQPGQSLQVCLDRQKDVCSRALVYEANPEADAVTRTHRVKARIADPKQMELGATCQAAAETEEKALRIPFSALASIDGRPCVWVIDEKTMQASPRTVVVASYTTKEVVIASGLKEGELIVTAGTQLLSQGQKVRIQ